MLSKRSHSELVEHMVGFQQFAPAVKTVLIVDDNALVRQALCEFFEREPDFKMCGKAENGIEAIGKAQRLRPDLIVLDFSMPVMNGFAAARILKQLMPAVPLIMNSAFAVRISEQYARSIGISELVSKSEHISVLIQKARRLVHPAPVRAAS